MPRLSLWRIAPPRRYLLLGYLPETSVKPISPSILCKITKRATPLRLIYKQFASLSRHGNRGHSGLNAFSSLVRPYVDSFDAVYLFFFLGYVEPPYDRPFSNTSVPVRLHLLLAHSHVTYPLVFTFYIRAQKSAFFFVLFALKFSSTRFLDCVCSSVSVRWYKLSTFSLRLLRNRHVCTRNLLELHTPETEHRLAQLVDDLEIRVGT